MIVAVMKAVEVVVSVTHKMPFFITCFLEATIFQAR